MADKVTFFDQHKANLLTVGGVVVVAVAATTIALYTTDNPFINIGDKTQISQPTQEAILKAIGYKDGEYYAEVSYFVEANNTTDIIGVTITVKNGAVESFQVSEIKESKVVENKYLKKFEDEIKTKVVGKSLRNFGDLGIVSGSTLTSNAFKEALQKIEQESLLVISENKIKDGTYSTRVSFFVDVAKRSHTIEVNLSLENGSVKTVSVNQIENNQEIEDEYTDKFVDSLRPLIVGKTLDDIESMALVSGSTLTSDAFKNALAKIESEAYDKQ